MVGRDVGGCKACDDKVSNFLFIFYQQYIHLAILTDDDPLIMQLLTCNNLGGLCPKAMI
jgi:hypothetical protein